MFVSTSILVFTTVPSRQSQLSFVVSEFHESLGDVEVARLLLLIIWFPVNQVITSPFPMITRHAHDETPMLLLDIHLSRGHMRVFSASRAERPPAIPVNHQSLSELPMNFKS
jgi:hypothetical protein